VPALFERLPKPPDPPIPPDPPGEEFAVVLRLRGHLRTNLTFVKALEHYADAATKAGGAVIVCGLHDSTIAQLRSAGLPDSILLLAQGEETDGSLADAYERARTRLAPPEQRPA
jgi:hypothetical protein